jgi:hypothetical protein
MVREAGLGRAYGSNSALSLRLFRDWRCLICGNIYDSKLTADHLCEFSHRLGGGGYPIRWRHRATPARAF